MKLEKIEFGGIKGRMLSALIEQIFEEFQNQYKVFTDSSYNCLDLADEVGLISLQDDSFDVKYFERYLA